VYFFYRFVRNREKKIKFKKNFLFFKKKKKILYKYIYELNVCVCDENVFFCFLFQQKKNIKKSKRNKQTKTDKIGFFF